VKGMAVVAIVGEGMAFTSGVASTFMSSLATANVNIRLISQGSLGEKRALFQFLVLHFLYYVMNDVALFQLY
jgi:predicted amino acid-binding ACT domain protein